MCTQKHSGCVQYSLAGVHVHSEVFRACSVLTQMQSFSLSNHGESHSIMTHWRPCTLNGCSILTHWHLCTLNGCSGAVPTHSLAFMCTQWVFMGCSILTHWCSCSLTNIQEEFNICAACSCTSRLNEYVLKFVKQAEVR